MDNSLYKDTSFNKKKMKKYVNCTKKNCDKDLVSNIKILTTFFSELIKLLKKFNSNDVKGFTLIKKLMDNIKSLIINFLFKKAIEKNGSLLKCTLDKCNESYKDILLEYLIEFEKILNKNKNNLADIMKEFDIFKKMDEIKKLLEKDKIEYEDIKKFMDMMINLINILYKKYGGYLLMFSNVLKNKDFVDRMILTFTVVENKLKDKKFLYDLLNGNINNEKMKKELDKEFIKLKNN